MIIFKKPTLFFLLCSATLAGNVCYATQVVCDIDISNSQYRINIKPSHDIYDFSKIDTAGDFRFSGQFLIDLHKFKAYVYHNSKNRYVLLATQEFALNPGSCSSNFGKNYIYSNLYEREFFYQCHQVCND